VLYQRSELLNELDFMHSLLQIDCSVKDWKTAEGDITLRYYLMLQVQ